MRSTRMAAVVAAAAFLASACGAGGSESAAAKGPGGGAVVASSAARLKAAIKSKRPLPVVANYWATWCDPCKKEMPRLVDASERYKRRIAFVGVNVEDDRDSARTFAKRYGIPFTSFALSRAEVQRSQDILGLPVTQFYSADGQLAFVHQGEISSGDLREKLDELLSVGRPVSKPKT